ncbi:MAG TPA: hypothetical protein VFW57_09520 [Acidimicrobiia bacterium]|nr:hypothetical protein [Acidimicrobiia bacterium]
MTTNERNLRSDFSVATDDDYRGNDGDHYRGSDGLDGTDDFRESDPFDQRDSVSVEHDGADLLFSPEDRARFGQRWTEIQGRFVDDPRDAVASADDLVTEMMDRIGDRLAECRTGGQGLAGEGEVETEDLRLATQRYRAFFHRLLSA